MTTSSTITMNRQGRVVLPAELRRQLGFAPDLPIMVYVEDGRLVLETQLHAARRAQKYVAGYAAAGAPVVDELIADRRAEAAAESA